jgi:molybdate transport system regulatory protein
VKTGDVMTMVKFDVIEAREMASVMTTESVAEMELKPGDEVELVIKAINVLATKA